MSMEEKLVMQRRYQHCDPTESDSREDRMVLPFEQQSLRRKSAPKNADSNDLSNMTSAVTQTESGASRIRNIDLKQSKSRDTANYKQLISDSYHSTAGHSDSSYSHCTPQHYSSKPRRNDSAMNRPNQQRRHVISVLKTKKDKSHNVMAHPERRPKKSCDNSSDYGQDSDIDISTASTSGSNSSSSNSDNCQISTRDAVFSMSVGMDSDEELELYSRQIRLELRQAEMLELAEEAERAAACGKKKFTGRASTFGDDSDELDLPTKPLQKKTAPATDRNIRKLSLDFGTPLRRSIQPEASKLSVVALRDVSEVVPSFKSFHLHLRTHFHRKDVDESILLFEELRDISQRKSLPNQLSLPMEARSQRDCASDRNMMHIWNSLNLGRWSSKGDLGNELECGSSNLDSNVDVDLQASESAADSDVGDVLAGHVHSPEPGSKSLRRSGVLVPPGLSLLDEQKIIIKKDKNLERRRISNPSVQQLRQEISEHEAAFHISTPKHFNRPGMGPGAMTADAPSQLGNTSNLHGSEQKTSAPIQDGSPNSPFIISEDLEAGYTPEQKGGRLYQGPQPTLGLPLTPKESFSSVFDKRFITPKVRTRRVVLPAYGEGSFASNQDMLGPDFVTPVRLRDIRDDKILASPDAVDLLPQAPHLDDTSTRPAALLNTFDTGTFQPRRLSKGETVLQNKLWSSRTAAETYGLSSTLPSKLPWTPMHMTNRDGESDASISASEVISSRSASAALVDENLDVTSNGSDILKMNLLSKTENENSWMANPQKAKQNVFEAPMICPSEDPEHEVIDLKDYDNENACPDGNQMSCEDSRPKVFQRVSLQSVNFSQIQTNVSKRLSYDDAQTGGESTQESKSRSNQGDHPSHLDKSVLQKEALAVDRHDSPNNASVLIDFIGEKLDLEQEAAGVSRPTDGSKATADFGCECLISPASSIESDEGDIRMTSSKRRAMDLSSWSLMEHGALIPSEGSRQPLKAAVAMFQHISPRSSRRLLGNVAYAPAKENDDFISNYLYCSKMAESPPEPEPMCSGSVPCQDTKIPCGEIAVDSCVGNLLDTALKLLPRRATESGSKKLLSLSRDGENEVQSKPLSWYDRANKRFDRLLESLIGNDHKNPDHYHLAFDAPALKERKSPLPPRSPPRNHEEVYDDDLEGVVYVKNVNSLDSDTSHSSSYPGLVDGRIHRSKYLDRMSLGRDQGQHKSVRPLRSQRGRHLVYSHSDAGHGGSDSLNFLDTRNSM